MAERGVQVAGKVALVTGGASGIGEACCLTLAREGASVVVTDIDEARGKDLVEKIAVNGGKSIFLKQDVSDEDRWPEVIAATEKAFGGLHVLVANAGIGILVPILEMTLADWRRQNAINLDGVFLSVKYGIPAMRRTGHGGSVIMMSSIAGLRGSVGLAGYSATKGGVRLFAKSVALECAFAKDGIRVNSVHPGVIDTPIWTKLPPGATGAHNNQPIDPRARGLWMIPLGDRVFETVFGRSRRRHRSATGTRARSRCRRRTRVGQGRTRGRVQRRFPGADPPTSATRTAPR
jgi:NAD(P)-dependent dehydrogenase (short-subunit alcohol dehydrogenase family)